MRISKKILAIALSILMAVSMMPFTVFAATTGVANGSALKTAIAAAADGDVIEFTADNTTYPESSGALVIPVDGKDITIDLKGHTQYFRVSGETAVSYPTDLFVLKNGAKLTVKDSVGGGAIYATYGANSAAYIFNVLDSSELVIDGGKFVMDQANYGGVIVYQNSADASTTINGGEFTANTGAKARRDYIVNNTRGDVEINGGTFTTARAFDYVISEGNTTDTSLTINAGEFNGTMSLDTTKATTELNGGTYKTYDGSAANTDVTAYLPADQIVDSTTGQIKNVDPSTVAKTNSAEFTSLKDALDSVAAGATATITLLDDCTLPSTYEIADNQKITIDLNGNDITTSARAFNIRHGQLTLKGTGNLNANFTGANAAVAVYGAATDSGSNYSTFTQNSTVTINAPNGYGAMIGANGSGSYGAKLQLNGTINSKYGVYINGNVAEPTVKTNAAAINITGTVTASNADAAVYLAGYAKTNIYSNANLTAGSGVYIKSGTLNIYGNAVINATGAKTDYVFNTNGCDATGDAVIIDSCGYPGNVPTVAIKAGTITSANGAAIASYAKQDDPNYPTAEFPRVTNVVPATSTAVFSSDVSALAEEGYETVYDAEKGGYVVAEDNHTVAKIGDAKYDTLKAAWTAAQDGDTIVLVQDCNGDGLVAPQNKFNTNGLTLDLNGYTYSVTGETVGSTGTETIGFQLLKGNKITIKDGTLYGDSTTNTTLQRMIQNYADLTLDNVTVDMKGYYYNQITMSNCNGTVEINNSTIAAPDFSAFNYTDEEAAEMLGARAMSVGTFASYEGVDVTTNNSTIDGAVNIDNTGTTGTASLSMNGGTVGEIKGEAMDNATVTNNGATVAGIPDNYEWVDNGDGTSSLAEDTHTVAKVGDAKYDSLEEALAAISTVTSTTHSNYSDPTYEFKTYVANGTITLVQDIPDGNGVIIGSGSDLTIDFNGHTYNVAANPVGSNGTETIGFQLLKDSDITFKDGAITTSDYLNVMRVIQNYSNLTLDNMDISMKGAYYDEKTMATSNGQVNIVNGSVINAPDYSWINPSYTDSSVFGGEALTVGTFATYTAASVDVQDSTINGDLSVDVSNPATSTNTVTLTSGTLTGDVKMLDNAAADTVEVTKANTFNQAAPEGYAWVDNGNGTSTLDRVAVDEVSITTSDKVEVNVYLDETGDEKTVTYTFNATPGEEADGQETVSVDFASLPVVGGKRQLTITVAPAQIRDNIDIAVKNAAGDNLRVYENYSVAEYCDQIVAGDYAENVKALANAVLDYGKAASAFFGYNTGAYAAQDYVNAGAFNWTADVTNNFAANATGNVAISQVRYVAKSVPDLRFVVGYDEATASALTATTDKGYTAEFVKVDDTVILQVTGIPAAKLNEAITISISDGSTITYTPLVYAYQASKSDNAALQQLGNSIAYYWQAANAVFA